MYHSITFAKSLSLYSASVPAEQEKAGQLKGVNTWEDWHLIPSSRPVISPAGLSTKFVTIPGKSGAIDMSEYLCGYPLYGDRSGTLEFYVDNDHEHWETIRMKIMNYLHGRRLYFSLEDDPRFFMEGRFTMDEWKSEAHNSKVILNYAAAPFKTALQDVGTDLDVIWNTFNFERDVDWRAHISSLLAGVTLNNGNQNFVIPESLYFMSVSATLQSGTQVEISYAGRTMNLSSADPVGVIYSDKMSGGTLTVSGTGTVAFGFRERSL